MSGSPAAGHGLEPAPPDLPASPRGPRTRYIVAALLCAAAIVYLVVFGLGSNIVYFRTPTEAAREAVHHRFRLAGAVVPGTVQPVADGVDFTVADNTTQVKVHHQGDTPALFKPGVPVVCEGSWNGTRTTFESDRILIKHDSNYTPRQQVNSVTTVTVEPQR